MTDSNFITNANTTNLKKRLVELVNNSRELKFLVGFFYFSGITELYESLKEKKDITLKVLVGLNVDKNIHGLVEYADSCDGLTGYETAERFFGSLEKSINSNDFDTALFYEQVKFFAGLIKQDKLVIRKTCRPNHAKLYLFKLMAKEVREAIFITGSSNLTRAGLETQEEFNVEISDYGTKDAEKYFDQLWDEPAVKITEDDELKKRLIEVIENKTLIADITPFEAFTLILKSYIESQSYTQGSLKQYIVDLLTEKNYKPYTYQLDAVSQALSIIKDHNGVIISDVVGLGKSVIACMVAKHLGKRGVIICRPGLIGDPDSKDSGWEKYKEDFELYDWDIRSSGKLDDALKLVKDNEEFEVVIVDEAHNFRNQDTEDYESLSNICRNKIVMLLTATPFNNTPGDIFSLLKLFIIPGKSGITLDDNLDLRFKEYKETFKKLCYINKNYACAEKDKIQKMEIYNEQLFGDKTINLDKVKERTRYLSNKIRAVIEPVLIRRNRLDLKKDPVYSKETLDLPEVKDPKELFFALTKEQLSFYDRVINDYFGEHGKFSGAIYRPYLYETGSNAIDDDKEGDTGSKMSENREKNNQQNLYEFMRRLLVKRFESSFGAFRQSLENFSEITEIVQKFVTKTDKYILDRKLLEKIYEYDLDEIEDELKKFQDKLKEGKDINPRTYKIYETGKFKNKKEFLDDIENDKRLFAAILEELRELKLVENDPKAESLALEIKDILDKKRTDGEPKRKIVVFTEYIATAVHLEEKLSKYFPGKFITVKGDLPSILIDSILHNFDASAKNQKDEFDILIATDKISEGFNLNRAGAIINYDIPWNPTRVIQRVGRINRIGKMVFKELFLYNSFPTEKGADIVKSRQIATDKMFLIHNTLGEDVKIFETSETPTAAKLYSRIMQNPESGEAESFQTKIRQKYYDIKEKYPDIIAKISFMPARIKTAKKYIKNNLLVFIKKGTGFFVRGIWEDDEKVQEVIFEDVYNDIVCEREEKRVSLSQTFWDRYEKVKNHKEHPHIPASEQSVEKRALNNLKSLTQQPYKEIEPYLSFLRILLEDIIDYKTLSLYTLRRIASLEANPNTDKDKRTTIEEIRKLIDDLGYDYLTKIKDRCGNLSNEIIIAVENRKDEAES